MTLILQQKTSFLVCFEVFGLNIFHLKDLWDILHKSSFKDIDIVLGSLITEKTEILPTNNLITEVEP